MSSGAFDTLQTSVSIADQESIERVLPLKEVLKRAGRRTDHWEGGAARTLMEVKGNITALYFLLRLWNSLETPS